MENYFNDAVVGICDMHGVIVWISNNQNKIGDYAWDHFDEEYSESIKSHIAKTATIGSAATTECRCTSGKWYRVWIWPLNSPDYSVCIIGVNVPEKLRNLTATERKLMQGMSAGKTVRQLANTHEVSISTVHTHLRRIRGKLDIDTHEALFGFAARYCTSFPKESDKNNSSDHVVAPSTKLSLATDTQGAMAVICDWRGTIIWISESGIMAEVGDPAWKFIRDDSKNRAMESISRTVTLREPQSDEGFNLRGEYYRTFCWPLLSPEAAVFILLVRIPAVISKLSMREREMVNMLAEGTPVKAIAECLDLSVTTVHSVLKSAREKLDLPSNESLVAFAARYCHQDRLPISACTTTKTRLETAD